MFTHVTLLSASGQATKILIATILASGAVHVKPGTDREDSVQLTAAWWWRLLCWGGGVEVAAMEMMAVA